ncbi:MAG: M13 family metallopeptidase [Gammaproteobacteria bacterium]|nr:M13 family metallopeptidase [Gammaproteobacteria bacterium]
MTFPTVTDLRGGLLPLLFPALLLAACGAEETAPTAGDAAPAPAESAAGASSVPGPELGSFGIDLSNQDTSVRPGDDFFRFANGLWLDSFELPADRSDYGSFSVLADRSDERVRSIIEDLADMEPTQGSIEQKINDYFLSFMDTGRLNELGISPLLPGLAAVDSIADMEQLIGAFGRAQLENTASPFVFFIGADRSDPDRHQLVLTVMPLSLPDRDYYLVDTEEYQRVREEFTAHIARILDFAEIPDSAAKAESILALETAIAEHLWPRAQRRDRDLTYNPMNWDEFVAEYPGFDWEAYFAAAGIGGLEDLNVNYPSTMAPVIALVNDVPLEDWKSYMSYRLINDSAGVLSEEIDRESFRFYATVLRGVPEQRERWERGVARVGSRGGLGEAVGQIYVERHFPESAKEQMQDLVENLRAALRQSIEQNDWMGPLTKEEAYLKLEAFRPKIAYPDVWEDLSAIEITRDSLFDNARNVREFRYRDEIERIGQPTDREEWGMTPQTVNAYYNSSFNEIVFPAGILQPPFFDPAADPAVNYGGIGAVIGHEMGHGFDDQGSKSDWAGVQRNWWTDEDRANFEDQATVIADQYAEFEPLPGYFVDGRFTLGENIGDVGGVSLAWRAYRMSLGGEEAPVIDGLTGDQRFFLAWAQVWQRKYRDDALIQRLSSDPHSPAEFRVNGVVRNFDAWYEAFDVQPEDDLYLPREDRVTIW